MTNPDVVIAEFMDEAAVESLSDEFEVLYDPALVDDRTALVTHLVGARALVVRNRTIVDADLLAAAPELTVVGRLGVGMDNIDTAACEERGIAVRPATGANTAAVAEYVIAAILVLTRGVFDATARVADGSWPRTDLLGGEVGDRTLGLIGLGAIAREIAGRARGLSMNVIAHDPYLEDGHAAWGNVNRVSFDDVVSQSDAVSIHVPLTNETRNLLDRDTIARMRRGSILINPSRGGIVDEDAVVNALRSGQLGGAAIDVFAIEPVSATAGARFLNAPNLIATPHIAGITKESNARVGAMTADNIRRHLRTGRQ